MSGKAAKIQITEQQQFTLEDIRRSVKSPKRLIQRASVILLAFGGAINLTIAQETGWAHDMVA